MARFFYACGFFDSVELKELILKRYHTLDFINDMDLSEFLEFVVLAKTKERDERIYMQWCAMLPSLSEYKTFDEFIDLITGANIDMRPTEVIIAEIESLHQKGEE